MPYKLRDVIDFFAENHWNDTPEQMPTWLFRRGIVWRGLFSETDKTGGGNEPFQLFPRSSTLSEVQAVPSVTFRDRLLSSVIVRVESNSDLTSPQLGELASSLLRSLRDRFGKPDLENVGKLGELPDVQCTWRTEKSIIGFDVDPRSRHMTLGAIPLDGELSRLISGRSYGPAELAAYRAISL